jgi:hypothetical protein
VEAHQEADANAIDKEDARLIYQTAITAWTYEGAQVWARFNTMLVVHGIFIVVIAQLFTSERPDARSVSFLLAAIGLLVSLLWLMITVRGFAYHNTFLRAAKQQETHLSIKFLSQRPGPELSGSFRFLGRVPMIYGGCAIIGLFLVLYSYLLFLL